MRKVSAHILGMALALSCATDLLAQYAAQPTLPWHAPVRNYWTTSSFKLPWQDAWNFTLPWSESAWLEKAPLATSLGLASLGILGLYGSYKLTQNKQATLPAAAQVIPAVQVAAKNLIPQRPADFSLGTILQTGPTHFIQRMLKYDQVCITHDPAKPELYPIPKESPHT